MNVKMILLAAINHVLKTCVLGASNKINDIQKTHGWVLFPQVRYNHPGQYEKNNNKWLFASDDIEEIGSPDIAFTPIHPNQDPLNDPQFCLSELHKEVLLLALLTQEKRAGNCHARCCLLAKYLWEHHQNIHRIELLEFNFDHLVVVVNRQGNLQKPATWGNNTLIIDSWYPDEGCIYTAQEFIEKANAARKFIKLDYIKQYQLGMEGRLQVLMETDWHNLSWTCYAEIKPENHLYPTYSLSPFFPLEDYYQADNTYTKELSGTLINDHKAHKDKFKACLAQLNRIEEEIKPCSTNFDLFAI